MKFSRNWAAEDVLSFRVRAGNWLGPSGLCNTVEAIVNHVQPGGLRCKVVASSGGGAPVMCAPRYERTAKLSRRMAVTV